MIERQIINISKILNFIEHLGEGEGRGGGGLRPTLLVRSLRLLHFILKALQHQL